MTLPAASDDWSVLGAYVDRKHKPYLVLRPRNRELHVTETTEQGSISLSGVQMLATVRKLHVEQLHMNCVPAFEAELAWGTELQQRDLLPECCWVLSQTLQLLQSGRLSTQQRLLIALHTLMRLVEGRLSKAETAIAHSKFTAAFETMQSAATLLNLPYACWSNAADPPEITRHNDDNEFDTSIPRPDRRCRASRFEVTCYLVSADELTRHGKLHSNATAVAPDQFDMVRQGISLAGKPDILTLHDQDSSTGSDTLYLNRRLSVHLVERIPAAQFHRLSDADYCLQLQHTKALYPYSSRFGPISSIQGVYSYTHSLRL